MIETKKDNICKRCGHLASKHIWRDEEWMCSSCNKGRKNRLKIYENVGFLGDAYPRRTRPKIHYPAWFEDRKSIFANVFRGLTFLTFTSFLSHSCIPVGPKLTIARENEVM